MSELMQYAYQQAQIPRLGRQLRPMLADSPIGKMLKSEQQREVTEYFAVWSRQLSISEQLHS